MAKRPSAKRTSKASPRIPLSGEGFRYNKEAEAWGAASEAADEEIALAVEQERARQILNRANMKKDTKAFGDAKKVLAERRAAAREASGNLTFAEQRAKKTARLAAEKQAKITAAAEAAARVEPTPEAALDAILSENPEAVEGLGSPLGGSGGGKIPPLGGSVAAAGAEGEEAAKATEALAEAAGVGKSAEVAAEAAKAAGFWSKTGKLLGKGLHIGGALLTPLMLLDIGLRIAEESGADIYGKKARERKIFGEDIASALDRNILQNQDKFNEMSTIPELTNAMRRITPTGRPLGIAEANAQAAFSNYMNNKQMRLAQLSEPSNQKPSVEELALRLGLPV